MELVDHERRFPQLIRTIENTILGEQSGGYKKTQGSQLAEPDTNLNRLPFSHYRLRACGLPPRRILVGTSRENLVETDAEANGRDGSAASPEQARRRFRRLPATGESERGEGEGAVLFVPRSAERGGGRVGKIVGRGFRVLAFVPSNACASAGAWRTPPDGTWETGRGGCDGA